MKLRPVGHNVLIKPFRDDITYKGLHLPDTAKARANDGIVIALGNWCESALRVGDWTVFSRKQATDVKHEGEDHIIIDERACIVIIQEDENVNG